MEIFHIRDVKFTLSIVRLTSIVNTEILLYMHEICLTFVTQNYAIIKLHSIAYQIRRIFSYKKVSLKQFRIEKTWVVARLNKPLGKSF